MLKKYIKVLDIFFFSNKAWFDNANKILNLIANIIIFFL